MTLGIPRLREILMTSEDNIKTPIMTLPCFSKDEEKVKSIARQFERYMFIDIINSVTIKQNIEVRNKQKFRKYIIKIKTETLDYIKSSFNYNEEDMMKMFKVTFIPKFVKSIAKQIKQHYKNSEIIVNKVSNRAGKATGGEDDEKEENEADFESKTKSKGKEESDEESNDENDYEDFETTKKKKVENTEETFTDSEEKVDTLNEDSVENDIAEEDEISVEEGEDTDEEIKVEEETEETMDKHEKEKADLLRNKNYSWENVRVENMLFFTDDSKFQFDLYVPFNQKNLLLKNIIDQVFKQINFKSVDRIKRCHVTKDDKTGNISIQLEGSNFKEVFKYFEHIDINKIYTNDIGSVLRIYGVNFILNFRLRHVGLLL
jgi:DNA-directed RNA polymerase I subunit RPA1